MSFLIFLSSVEIILSGQWEVSHLLWDDIIPSVCCTQTYSVTLKQHPTSRLHLRSDLLALCILILAADTYCHFDIWITEPTLGLLLGKMPSLFWQSTLEGTLFRQKSWELLNLCSNPVVIWARHKKHFILGRWNWINGEYSIIPKEKEVLIFFHTCPEDCLHNSHSMCSLLVFQNWWTPDGITIWTYWPPPVCLWP